MARHLHTILGDMLVTQLLDSQNPEELPSPEVMLPDPQPGWGEGLAPRSTSTSLVQAPSPLSVLTFLRFSVHLTSATLWSSHLSAFHFD